MTRLVIVPNELRAAIYARIDEALLGAPPAAAADRESMYRRLLAYYATHGTIPAFTIAPKDSQ